MKEHEVTLGLPKTPDMQLFARQHIVVRADNVEWAVDIRHMYNKLDQTTVGGGPFLRESGAVGYYNAPRRGMI